jgi:hypothetical protein
MTGVGRESVSWSAEVAGWQAVRMARKVMLRMAIRRRLDGSVRLADVLILTSSKTAARDLRTAVSW